MKKPKLSFAQKIVQSSAFKKSVAPILLLATSLLLLLFKVTSLIPYTEREFASNLGSTNLDSIQNDIAYGPLKIAHLFILKFTSDDVYTRLTSVAVAATAGLLLFLFLRRWQTNRVSFMTALLFITSTYFLQLGRSVNFEVYYLAVIPAVLLGFMWLISGKESTKLPLVAILFGLALYAPGAVLFILIAGLFLRKVIIKSLKLANKAIVSFSTLLFVLLLSPLIASLTLHPNQIPHWLGFSTEGILNFKDMTSRALSIPNELFMNGINDPAIWLHKTPILDIFLIAMFLLGAYAYRAGYYPTREKLIFGSGLLALVLIIFGNVTSIALLIPVIFIIISNGLSYMLQSWFAVFPKNPFARPLGIILILIVVMGSCFYQLQRYFVAWPNAEPTINALTTESTSVTIEEEETN